MRPSSTAPESVHDLADLVYVTMRVYRHHQQHLVVVDDPKDGVMSRHCSWIIEAILDKLDGLRSCRVKVVERFVQSRETISRLRHFRRFKSPASVGRSFHNQRLARNVHHGSRGMRGSENLAEQVLLRQGNVLHTLPNRPSAWPEAQVRHLIRYIFENFCERTTSRFQVLNEFDAILDMH